MCRFIKTQTEDAHCFYNATDAQMKAVMDEILGTFHQSALVLEKTDADIIFYSGEAQQ